MRCDAVVRAAILTLTLATGAIDAFAQPSTATLTGTALDETHAVLPRVQISVINADTRIERRSVTNDEGVFSVLSLLPGRYSVTAERAGFATVRIPDVALNVGEHRSFTVLMKVGSVADTVVVSSRAVDVQSTAVTTLVDRDFLQDLPLDGRTLHGLLELTPGVVLASGQGQFSVNGQRDNANYFTVDGVGVNTGIAAIPSLGPTAGGTVPAFSALGSTTSFVSVDAVEEFRVQTSGYAAEFGRTPGGQVSLVTRSGTNAFHGSAFEYFRDDALDANDWFVNSLGTAKPPLRQNDFGGVAGGPIVRSRTFFFVSYEALRLRQPQVKATPVPTLSARQSAPPGIQPYLMAFPVANGPNLGNDLAQFAASYSNSSSLDAVGVRIDHTIRSGITIFGRYNDVPSDSTVRGGEIAFNALSSLVSSRIDTRALTLGLTQTLGTSATHEVRFNRSETVGRNFSDLDRFGGAVPPSDAQIFPPFAGPDNAQVTFQLQGPNAGYAVGKNVDNRQRQLNLVDTVSMAKGTHLLKAGMDYRRLTPVLDVLDYSQQSIFSNGATGAISGQANQVFIFSIPVARFPVFDNLSAYLQDTWRISSRATATGGLRWEWNPPPSEANGNVAYTVVGLDNPAIMTLAPLGTPLWKTTYRNFAPRLGVAYQLGRVEGRESLVRGGAGLFHDLGTGPIGSAFQEAAFPYFSMKSLPNVAFPLAASDAQPAPVSMAPPYQNLVVADPNLALPRTYEWSVALEQTLVRGHVLSITYVGAAGRRLLRGETLFRPNPDFGNVSVVRNAARSEYRALQVQYRHPLTRGLQALASYSLARSTDNASNESFGLVPAALIDPAHDQSPSNFDIRHSLSAGVTYLVPSATITGVLGSLARNWSIDSVIRARSAAPVNVVAQPFLFGVRQAARPDLVAGVPLYLHDPTAPGGMRFNPAAFVTPAPGQQGTLGRNALRGFPISQVDLSVRRGVNLRRHKMFEIGADIFNVFNHPNFADPDGLLGDGPSFGRSNSMYNQSVGGLSPLYQLGGPRSIQLSLKYKM
jgi:hypothetical protein